MKINEEFKKFSQDKAIDFKLLSKLMTPQSQTIKTKKPGAYKAFGLFFNGKSFLQVIEDYQLTWPQVDPKKLKIFLTAIMSKYFQTTLACIAKANAIHENIIRTVYFSVFEPGLDIKCHVNYNPHTYRGYLGLTVPEGDVAMKIGGEKLFWHEGEVMVLDHTFPHCPHNYTKEPRVALIIDFFRPEKNRNEMLAVENRLVTKRMQDNPYGFGVFGDDDYVTAEDLKKYGFEHQQNWDDKLF